MSEKTSTDFTDEPELSIENGPDMAALVRDILNPYVAIGSTLITMLGILGGWPKKYLALAIFTFFAMGVASSVLGSYWKHAKGTPEWLMMASAGIFVPLTAVLVVISGGLDSPIWLLFLVGSLTAAFSNSRTARLSLLYTCLVAAPAMWVPNLLERGVVIQDLATLAMRMISLIVVWGMTNAAIREAARVLAESSRLEKERRDAVDEAHTIREQLRHAQKMEALGRLAGGIAHDFNNLLTVIMGISSGLREDLDGQNALTDDIDDVLAASARAAELTHQLLVFSRRDVLNLIVVDLNEVVQHTEKMLGRLIRDNIHFEVRQHEQPLRILADRGELEQVILNLAVNARDAMPTGGEMTITCSQQYIEDKSPMLRSGMPPETYVVLRIADTGTGMTEEVKARAFEPFFTTKDLGAGTGLGLATVYGIVSKYQGNVYIETVQGSGTTIHLIFRKSDETVTERMVAEKPLAQTTHNNFHVIVVEDSPRVRNVVVRTLERANYQVSAYENPPQLLADTERLDAPFQLLIADVVMPKMSGMELVRTLREQNISTPTLFISGYTGDSAALITKVHGDALLMKPFSQSELLAAVENVITEHKSMQVPQKT